MTAGNIDETRRRLTKFTSVKKWLHSIGSQSTRDIYLMILDGFCNWAGRSPDELIEDAERAIAEESTTEVRSSRMKYAEHLVLNYTFKPEDYVALRDFYLQNGILFYAGAADEPSSAEPGFERGAMRGGGIELARSPDWPWTPRTP